MEKIDKQKFSSPETREKAEPIFIDFNDDVGEFKIIEEQNGTITINVSGGDGRIINLNLLLPKGYEITGNLERGKRNEEKNIFEEEGTYGNVRKKEIVLSEKDARREGWKYLLTILHEIGHAVRAEQKSEEVNEMLALYDDQNKIQKDGNLLAKLHRLASNDERDSWAFAIRRLRKVVKDAEIPFNHIFPDREALRRFIEERLKTYKESALGEARWVDLPENEKARLFDEISKLYVHEQKIE